MKGNTDQMLDSVDTITVPDFTNLSQKITQLLNAVFYASNDAMLLLDNEGTILILNPEAEEVFGITDDQSRGGSFCNFIPEQNRKRFLDLLRHFAQTSAEGSTALDKMEIAAKRSDNTLFPMEISLSIVSIDNEIFFIATVSDIAKRRRTEVEMSMLAHAMKSISEGLVIIDLSGNIIFTNDIFCQMCGYENTEFKNQNISLICSNEEKEIFKNKIIPAALENRWEGELLSIKKDGSDFPFHFSTSTVDDDSGNPILLICVGRDITERKQLEEQLRQAQKMEAIGQLAGGVAHDFNNLLIVISGYSNNILNTLDKSDPHYKNINQIHKAADRAASLTRQLLAFSRKQILQPKLLDLNLLIHDTEKMLRRLIGENIKLHTDLSNNLSHILADPGQIEQVIMNLVVNARDAMPDGGILTISTSAIKLDSTEVIPYKDANPGEYVVLKITDTGQGMSNQIKERIFEPFYTTKAQGKGTGLGLSTVYGIVEQSGCHIMVDSEINLGTTFNIIFKKQEPVEPDQSNLLSQHDAKQIHGKETILVVEDEDQVRELVTEMLKTYGYNILQAINGKEAINVYNENRDEINLILTDVVMPEMGGKKLIESLTNFKPGTKVLYMSGYTDNAIDEQGILDPGTQFIQKPFSPRDLLDKVRSVLDIA